MLISDNQKSTKKNISKLFDVLLDGHHTERSRVQRTNRK